MNENEILKGESENIEETNDGFKKAGIIGLGIAAAVGVACWAYKKFKNSDDIEEEEADEFEDDSVENDFVEEEETESEAE